MKYEWPARLKTEHKMVKANVEERSGIPVRTLRCACGWSVAGPASDLSEHEAVGYFRLHVEGPA